MHTNVISANKLVGVVHHNDNISISGAADFHGNDTESFRNLQHDFVVVGAGILFLKAISREPSRELVDGAHIQKQLTILTSNCFHLQVKTYR